MKNMSTSDWFVLGAAVVVILSLLYNVQSPRWSPVQTDAIPSSIRDVVGSEDVGSLSSNVNVFLLLSPTCEYCFDSLPFYKELTHLTKREEVNYYAVLSTDTQRHRQGLILQTAGVEVDDLFVYDMQQYGILGVPGIIVTDRDLTVETYWHGYLSVSHQQQFIKELKGIIDSSIQSANDMRKIDL